MSKLPDITEKWARAAEPGPRLDRVCAEWMDTVRHVAHVSDDGGESSRAWVSREGPWTTERQLREWLEEQQEQGYHTEFEIVQVPKCPPYSTSWSAAGPLLEAMISPKGSKYNAIIEALIEGAVSQRTGQRARPQHIRPIDVARVCAVLVARGVGRGDLE